MGVFFPLFIDYQNEIIILEKKAKTQLFVANVTTDSPSYMSIVKTGLNLVEERNFILVQYCDWKQ